MSCGVTVPDPLANRPDSASARRPGSPAPWKVADPSADLEAVVLGRVVRAGDHADALHVERVGREVGQRRGDHAQVARRRTPVEVSPSSMARANLGPERRASRPTATRRAARLAHPGAERLADQVHRRLGQVAIDGARGCRTRGRWWGRASACLDPPGPESRPAPRRRRPLGRCLHHVEPALRAGLIAPAGSPVGIPEAAPHSGPGRGPATPDPPGRAAPARRPPCERPGHDRAGRPAPRRRRRPR